MIPRKDRSEYAQPPIRLEGQMVFFRRDNTLNVEDDLTVVLFNVTVNHQIPSNSVDRLGVEIRELYFL